MTDRPRQTRGAVHDAKRRRQQMFADRDAAFMERFNAEAIAKEFNARMAEATSQGTQGEQE